ncbi:putative bifunctional diguanylate cyclase/phosphodiesterase [Microvirga brassicacearum]|uniref:EAL domain-containing protein n=1 Tax=Microvirga brassicacearum TaxID=2580413 RepID=A0A5N3P7R2_9HYPH|nr:EAL domain-containing protein [Microvirga brassicacearum]KAB0265752.1 EAL domain-containing protein [Microvirga brassicacearum]
MRLRVLQIVLAVVIGCFVVGGSYLSWLIVERQTALSQVSRYNTSWLASQALSEFTRFQQRLSGFALSDGSIAKNEVELRFDILVSRATLLADGEFQDFVKGDPERQATVQQLTEALDRAQTIIAHIELPGLPRQLLSILQPLETRLAVLASAANRYGAERVAEDQQELIRLHWLFSSLAGGLIVCGFLLMGLLGWHNHLLRRAHLDLRLLTENLQRTSAELEQANTAVGTANAELQFQNETLQLQEVELRTQNDRFEAALNNMSHGLCMVDSSERIIVFNGRFAQLFDLHGEMQPGNNLAQMVGAANQSAEGSAILQQIFLEQRELVRDRRSASFIKGQPGSRIISISHQPMSAGGWVATYEDITERQQAESRIAYMAHHDSLTGLANRMSLRERMEQLLMNVQHQEASLAVLCLDLDRFKEVNDSLGHETGDALLMAVADRLRGCVRGNDLVARVGGDEFAVLHLSQNVSSDSDALARRLIDAISEPFDLDGQEVVIGTSIGIALAVEGSLSSNRLLKHADLALYRAKASGRGNFRYFEPDMDLELQARRALELDLRKAMSNGEFEVVYQPQINIEANEISGFEALLRWHHPIRGSVPPSEFIPVAEDIGLILPLGEWVLQQACATAAAWPRAIRVAVNLSAVQFRSRTLVQRVASALAKSGLASNRLELEITESVLLNENESTVATLHELRGLGIRIAMDDFGTGYSSLSYLRSFPFDKIKIDQSFVRELSTRADCLAIVQSIASLGASLRMTTSAEGVETKGQFDQIRAAGCTEVQGFYFQEPKPAEALVFSTADLGSERIT